MEGDLTETDRVKLPRLLIEMDTNPPHIFQH